MNLEELNNRKEKKEKKKDSKFNLKVARPSEGFIGQLEILGSPKILGAGEVGLVLTSLTEEGKQKYFVFGFSTQDMSKNFILSVYGVRNATNKSLDISELNIPDARIPGAVRKLIYLRTLRSFLKENLQTEIQTENQKDTEETEDEKAKESALQDFTEETEEERDYKKEDFPEYDEYEKFLDEKRNRRELLEEEITDYNEAIEEEEDESELAYLLQVRQDAKDKLKALDNEKFEEEEEE